MPEVRRLPVQLYGSLEHLVHLPLIPVGTRLGPLFERIGRLTDEQVSQWLAETLGRYTSRHVGLAASFESRYRQAQRAHRRSPTIGRSSGNAWPGHTCRWSTRSRAWRLFNPSIVPHPNQDGVAGRGLAVPDEPSRHRRGARLVDRLSHGHHRRRRLGDVDPPPAKFARAKVVPDQHFLKHLIRRKLGEMGLEGKKCVETVLGSLGETFTISELNHVVAQFKQEGGCPPEAGQAVETLIWLARSNYHVTMPKNADVTQLVLYPVMQEEAHGVEDLRLVRFVEDDGSAEYFGTYVAYDGKRVLPMMIMTRDFRKIEVHSINGAAAQDKGMALFPRRVNGHYVMCSRIDGENLYIMYSDMPHFWESATLLARPHAPWNLLQLGNCGSPIETPEGWLLITHGVGPMRNYSIGAMLLDLDDPLKVRGRLNRPLLAATPDEQYGNVPNVVYTCGSMIHNGTLYMPFALTDRFTTMAAIDADELIRCLIANGT